MTLQRKMLLLFVLYAISSATLGAVGFFAFRTLQDQEVLYMSGGLALAFVIATLTAYFVIFVTVRSVDNQLKTLTEYAHRAAKGNLLFTVHSRETRGEVRELFLAFEAMMKGFKENYSHLEVTVRGKADSLEHKVTELEQTKIAAMNILEDLHAEQIVLENARARDKATLASIGEGLIVTDEKGRMILMNEQVELLFGIKGEESVGRLAYELLPAQDIKGVPVPVEERPLYKVLHGAREKLVSNFYYKGKNDVIFPALVTATPIVLGNAIVGSVGVIRDITKEIAVDRAKTEFVSLASHQLRTPLSAINWYVEMLLAGDAGPINDEQKQYLSEVEHSNKRMVDLVGSLLNVSRIDLGTFAVDLMPTNLVEIADSVLGEIMPQIITKKQKLEKKYSPDLPVIPADPKLIRIVFQNYLTNAVKYTPAEGSVFLNVVMRKEQKDILISVKDTGYGIPADAQSKIFTKLYRADNVRQMETDGTGLGLYIVKAIIEQSGGKAWFESVEGQGSAFFATIPETGMKKKEGAKGLS